jgi:hypothetical protein
MKIYYNDVASRTLAYSDVIKFCEKQAEGFLEINGIFLKPNTLLKAMFIEEIKDTLEKSKTAGLYDSLAELLQKYKIPENEADQMLSQIVDVEKESCKIIARSPFAAAVVKYNALEQIEVCLGIYQQAVKYDQDEGGADPKRIKERYNDIDEVCLSLKQDIQRLKNQLVSEFPNVENPELVEDRDYFPILE